MATRSGDSSARRSRRAISRPTAPSLWWSIWKPRRSEGGSGVRSRGARPSSSPLAPDRGAGPSARRPWTTGGPPSWSRPRRIVGGAAAMRPYLRAKSRADKRLKSSGLDYTIIRPGSLTEDEGTGTIEAAEKIGRRGEIPREDVPRIFAEALENKNTYHKTFVTPHDTPALRLVATVVK